MSTKIIAIDLSARKVNIIFNTMEEARSCFTVAPQLQKKMQHKQFRDVLRHGKPVYMTETQGAFCLDELLEPEK